MMKPRWLGTLAGLLLGAGDSLLMVLLGVEMTMAGSNVLPTVMGFYALTFAVLGYSIGYGIERRREITTAARTIERQYEALRQSRAKAAHLEQLAGLGRLAASVAHEVRNPLGVIRSSAGLLAESAQSNRAEKASRFIMEEIDRLDAFVRRMLDFSRPLVPEQVEVDVDELFTRVESVVQNRLQENSATLQTSISPALSSWDLDPDLLVSALATLVDNAVAAVEDLTAVEGMNTAGEQGRIRLSAAVEDGFLSIDVRDNGTGVQDAREIFEPFVTTRAQGSGLGLPMARRVAEAHGGSLSFEGEGLDGRGAHFRLLLPPGLTRNKERTE